MPEALRLLPFLLAPVLALLFLNLRLSRKLTYPHDLLRAEARRGLASALFRSFRTYYDVLLDGLLALVLAFALFPPAPRRPAALVVDGSRSMLGGFGDERPILKALRRLRADKGARPFLLAFEPSGTRLVDLRPYLQEGDNEAVLRRLRTEYDFFAPDYQALAELRRQGFGEITLLTDQPRFRAEGLRVEALGFPTDFAAYPTSVRFDRLAGSWRVALTETGPRVSLAVSVWNAGAGGFVHLGPERYSVEEEAAGRVLHFAAPGLYRLTLRGPYGLDDIDLPLLLPARDLGAAAAGPFSTRVLSIFPDLDRQALPSRALVDLGTRPPAGLPALASALQTRPGSYLLDPARTGGALVAVGAGTGADLGLGPNSVANDDLVRVYESFLHPAPVAFLEQAPGGELTPVGSSFLVRGTRMPVLAGADRFFESRPRGVLVLPPPASARWPWAAALAVLALLKLLLWRRMTGRALLLRD